ncbi:epididymal secretory protein E3-beta-like protein [Cricetulus griseus]|nr:epididymal secretory protein E3-beta-like protein [Cricetulus griseus]
MALQRTWSLLLLLVLTLLGLGLVQPSYGQNQMYQRFLRQHVSPQETGGNDNYCNLMMQRRKMTSRQCKHFNTFIHEDIWNIRGICSTSNIQCKNGRMNCHEGVMKVALVAAMEPSLKAWGLLVFLLCLQYSSLAQSTSRREFMEYHHLSPHKEFSGYSCDVLMTEKGLKPKISHSFVYMAWYKVEHICISGNWKDRYRNSYVWAQTPIKVLECHRENFKGKYIEKRSYNYVQFHCNADGYVDSIEDMKVLEPIFA